MILTRKDKKELLDKIQELRDEVFERNSTPEYFQPVGDFITIKFQKRTIEDRIIKLDEKIDLLFGHLGLKIKHLESKDIVTKLKKK